MSKAAKYASVILLSLLTCSSGFASDKEQKKRAIWKNIGKLSISRLGSLDRFLPNRDKFFYGFDYLNREMESPSYRGPIPPKQFSAFTDCEGNKRELLNEIESKNNNKEDKSIGAKAVEHYYSFCYLQREKKRRSEPYTRNIMHDLWNAMVFNEEKKYQKFEPLHKYAMSLFAKLKKINNALLKKNIEDILLGYFLTHGMRTFAKKIIEKHEINTLIQSSRSQIIIIAKAELAFYEKKWYEAYIWYDKLIQDKSKTRYLYATENYATYMSGWCCYKLGYFDEASLYFKSVSGRSGEVTKATLIDSQRLYSANRKIATSKTDPFPY